MNPIETKEIRGLNLKLLITLVFCTASIVATVVGTYFSLLNKIENIQEQRLQDDRFNELRLKTFETTISVIQTRVDNLQNDVNVNRQAILKVINETPAKK